MSEMSDEQAYYDNMRKSWYRRIENSGYDGQVVADLIWTGTHELLDAALSNPDDGLILMEHLSHIINLTCAWFRVQRADVIPGRVE